MDIDSQILNLYTSLGSVKAVSLKTGYSWNKITKSLSSNGIVINDIHRLILDLYDNDMTVDEISKQLKINKKTVQSYLPRVRPVYGQNLSKNAIKIKKWRNKKFSK